MRKKMLFWTPRAMLMILGLFTVLFSFDAFEGNGVWFEKLLGFVLHNIPAMLIAVILILSWKRPGIGAIASYLVMLGFAFIVRSFGHIETLISFMLPPFLAGTLFLVESWQNCLEKKKGLAG